MDSLAEERDSVSIGDDWDLESLRDDLAEELDLDSFLGDELVGEVDLDSFSRDGLSDEVDLGSVRGDLADEADWDI